MIDGRAARSQAHKVECREINRVGACWQVLPTCICREKNHVNPRTGLRKIGSILRITESAVKSRVSQHLEESVKPPYDVAKAGQGEARQRVNHIDGIDATNGTAATWPASSIIDA